jgi:hypothetical protein
MPVTYFSSTGTVSFAPVPARDQAVGPLEVITTLSPPDEVIDPGYDSIHTRLNRSELLLGTAAFSAVMTLIVTAALVAG